MRLTARRLNRATLGRQSLLRREPLGAAEGVRRAVALQAQEAVSPYLALWNRSSRAGREPIVYRRYARWWAGLPAAEVRVLPG